jgi:RNA polymerase sigma factor (sigma-70 family)
MIANLALLASVPNWTLTRMYKPERQDKTRDVNTLNPHTVISENTGLIWYLIQKYAPYLPKGLEREDLYQSACERILVDLHKFNPERGKLSNYLQYLIRHGINVELKRWRWQHFGRPENFIEGREQVSMTDTVEVLSGERDDAYDEVDIFTDLYTLSERERMVVVFLLSGMSGEEVGERLGVSRQRIDQLKRQAMRNLGYTSFRDAATQKLVVHG